MNRILIHDGKAGRQQQRLELRDPTRVIIIIIIIIIKNEKIRVKLCKNAAGALYIVIKMCVDGQRNVQELATDRAQWKQLTFLCASGMEGSQSKT